MERKRRQGNSTPQKASNSTQDLMGNEENEYLVPDPNRMTVNMTYELKNIQKKMSQRGNHERAH
jgi:hypothetical protein